jgi:histone deacetylase 1/2
MLHLYSSERFHQELITGLESEYGPLVTKTGDSGIYVGIEYQFDRKSNSVNLTMKKYLNQLCDSYKVVKTEITPCTEDMMEPDDSSPKVDSKSYASLVMALYYAALRVRPDILFAVNYLSTRTTVATAKDMKSAYRVLKYVNGTRNVGIVLKPSGLRPHFYIDASFMIHLDGRSHTGGVFCLGGDEPSLGTDGPTTTWCGVQRFITVSSTESEMSAVFQLHQWFQFYKLFMAELRLPLTAPMLVMQDNDAAKLNFEVGFRGRTKPLNMRYHYLRELVQEKVIKIVRVPTDVMLADPLTKPFYSKVHLQLIKRLLNDPAMLASVVPSKTHSSNRR